MRLAQVLILAVAGVACGCAGAADPFIDNPYRGTYTGTFTTSDGHSGPASVELTNIGNVFGTLTDSETNEEGSLRGSVNTSGTFDGRVKFGDTTREISGKFNSSNGTSTVTFTGEGDYELSLTLTS